CAAPSRGPAARPRARARPLCRRASPGPRHRPLRLLRHRARRRRVARAARALLPARARAVAWRRLVPECFLLRPRRGGHRSALRGRRRRGAHLFSAGSRGARPPQVWRRVLHLHGAHRAGAEGARAARLRPLFPRGVHTALAAHVGHAALPKLQRGGRPRRLRGGPCRGRRAAGGAPPSTSPAGAAI
ncbi:hypothetical protein EMIHUDRAFT_471816, partial [Emiliania huxleyi CCMP1516]